MRSPSRWNTNGRTRPAFLSASSIAICSLSSFSMSAVNGNDRPSPFFVVPGSRRTQRPAQSTCRHSRGRTSLAVRQPVAKANRDDVRQLARLLAAVVGSLRCLQSRADGQRLQGASDGALIRATRTQRGRIRPPLQSRCKGWGENWSGRRDSNSRPPAPKAGVPVAAHRDDGWSVGTVGSARGALECEVDRR